MNPGLERSEEHVDAVEVDPEVMIQRGERLLPPETPVIEVEAAAHVEQVP